MKRGHRLFLFGWTCLTNKTDKIYNGISARNKTKQKETIRNEKLGQEVENLNILIILKSHEERKILKQKQVLFDHDLFLNAHEIYFIVSKCRIKPSSMIFTDYFKGHESVA